MEPPVNKIRSLNAEIIELKKRLNRAKTSGKSGDVEIKINGQGMVEVIIGESYKLSDKARQELSADLAQASQQALDKHKKRITRESSKILNNG